MARTLRNISAVKIKSVGAMAPGGIYACGIMNDGTWAAGGFRITNNTGANTGDQGLNASVVAGTCQYTDLSHDCRFMIVRSSTVRGAIVKKATTSGNFGASVANFTTLIGDRWIVASAWMKDNRHFWVAAANGSADAGGGPTIYLLRYDPDTDTVVQVTTYGGMSNPSNFVLSPDGYSIVGVDTAASNDGFFVLRLNANYTVRAKIGITSNYTSTAAMPFWHPRLDMLGWVKFTNNENQLTLVRWNGTSYVPVTVPAVGGLARGGGFLFGGSMAWAIQGTTLKLYDVSTDGLTVTENTTLAKPTVIANTTIARKSRTTDDNGTLGMFLTASGAYILASSDLAVRGNIDFPKMQADISAATKAAGTVDAVFPKMNADITARRNEYFALDAVTPKMLGDVMVGNHYGDLVAVLPVARFSSVVAVLDEPYEPYETRLDLGEPVVALKADGASAEGVDAGQFVYSLGFELPLMQAEIMGSQPYEASGEFVTPAMTASILMGEVPKVTGDFVAPLMQFDAVAALWPVGELDAVFPNLEFDAEGVLPQNASILEALFPTLSADIETFQMPGGFIEADFPPMTFEAEGLVPFGAYLEAVLPMLVSETLVNVPTGVLLDAEFPLTEFDTFVNVPVPAYLDAQFPSMQFDGLIDVPFVTELDAAFPLMVAEVDAIFKYQASIDALFPLLEFAGLPPLPVDVELDAVTSVMLADLFGGPDTQATIEAVFPKTLFEGGLIKGPRVDANIRFPKMSADILTKFTLAMTVDAVFPVLQADLFGGEIVKVDLDAVMPSLVFRGILRQGDEPGTGEPFTLTYHKISRRRGPFSPIKARFG